METALLTVLGSGSAGNAAMVAWGGRAILLDCGFSARETVRRIRAGGSDESSIDAIVVSHEHGDHVRGVRVLARRLGVPVFASRGTIRATRLHERVDDVRVISAGESVRVAGMTVTPFRTAHDAAEPLGFRFDTPDGDAVGILTDSGCFTEAALEVLRGCTRLGVETNHDVGMLVDGPYPWFLKNRVLSERGHLSNEDAASVITALAADRLKCVAALHLSRTNNRGALVREALSEALGRLGHPARVVVTEQDASCTL